eukprot:6209610-Pleurochrysis_carterae.AAC.2
MGYGSVGVFSSPSGKPQPRPSLANRPYSTASSITRHLADWNDTHNLVGDWLPVRKRLPPDSQSAWYMINNRTGAYNRPFGPSYGRPWMSMEGLETVQTGSKIFAEQRPGPPLVQARKASPFENCGGNKSRSPPLPMLLSRC